MINIHNLHYNHTSGYYEITERGITYQMALSQMHLLKQSSASSCADWYLSLPGDDRRKVKRVGIPAQPGDDFYPDPEY